jgi:hypothetical protein
MSLTVGEAGAADVDSACITELTKHCILHACTALAPTPGVLASGSQRIEQFCQELLASIQSSKNDKVKEKGKKKKAQAVPQLPVTVLVPEVDILRFYEGVTTTEDFTLKVCYNIAQLLTDGDINDISSGIIHRLCWTYYSERFKADISYPKWFTNEDTYLLWLTFCSHLSSLSIKLNSDTLNDILKELVIKAGFSWNESSHTDTLQQSSVDFLSFLHLLMMKFDHLQVTVSVISEIIMDLKDEMVDGVLRKGYMFKKGHRVHSWKRRFFILTRQSLSYYESRGKPLLKGTIVINNNTRTSLMEDKEDNSRKYKFVITCGETEVDYVMSADDSKTRNEWIKDVKKAIQLEQAFSQSDEHEFTRSIASYYQLKYGTSAPKLERLDSTIRRAGSCSPLQAKMIKKLSTSNECVDSLASTSTSSVTSPTIYENQEIDNEFPVNDEFYEEMDSNRTMVEVDNNTSDDENDGYTYMFQGKKTNIKKALDEDMTALLKQAMETSLEVKQSMEEPERIRLDDNSLVYEECFDSPRYIPTAETNEENSTGRNQRNRESVNLSHSLPKSRHDMLGGGGPGGGRPSSAMMEGNKNHSNDYYISILPSTTPDEDIVKLPMNSPSVPPRSLANMPAAVSPLDSPTHKSHDDDMNDSSGSSEQFYYITPPPVPAHRTRGHTP